MFLYVVLFVGLEEGKQSLFFADRATTQHNRQGLQQRGFAVERLVLLVFG